MNALARLYRRLRYGEPVIVVSGLPRSGTSMAMKMLEAGGLEVVQDGIRSADEDNPKGYFELEQVKDLSGAADRGWVRGARGRCIKVISYLLKDLPANNNYRVLFMRRAFEEVLASQAKMLERRGESNESEDGKMIDLYQSHLWRVGYLFDHAAHLDRLDIDYREVLSDPVTGARRMNEFVGGSLDEAKMAAMVDEKLYRNRSGEGP